MSNLRHIINSIGHSIWPLLDALFLVMIVVSMYALIGVDAFAEESGYGFGYGSFSYP